MAAERQNVLKPLLELHATPSSTIGQFHRYPGAHSRQPAAPLPDALDSKTIGGRLE
jgi:hypothetical protein